MNWWESWENSDPQIHIGFRNTKLSSYIIKASEAKKRDHD